MPHCLLEYSNNIVDKVDFRQLLLEINRLLASTKLFNMGDIKSRVIAHDLFVIGDGTSDRTFVTINVCILAGRDKSVKTKISNSMLGLLESYFPKTKAETECSLTVRITEMDKESYAKAVSYKNE